MSASDEFWNWLEAKNHARPGDVIAADPREDAIFRARLVAEGEFEPVIAWIVGKAIDAAKKTPARARADWSRTARLVASVVDDHTKGWPEKPRRKAFRDAYPFGPRELWPYRAWCIAVADLQGRKLAKRRRNGRAQTTRGAPPPPTAAELTKVFP